MKISRRHFLEGSLVALGSGILSATGWLWFGGGLNKFVGSSLKREEVLQILVRAAKEIIAVPVNLSAYEEFFRWRYDEIPTVRERYREYAGIMNERARTLYRRGLLDCDSGSLRKLVEPLAESDASERRVQQIHREILERFLWTDAWILSGYESFPGQPRGLEYYKTIPISAE